MSEKPKNPNYTWTQVLGAVRKIAGVEDAPFTVEDVLSKLPAYDPAKAAKMISKFVLWGYALRGEFEAKENRKEGQKKPRRIYHITKYGLTVSLEGGQDHITRLIDAVQGYRDFYQTGDQAAEMTAAQYMFEILDEVIRLREERFKKKEM